MSVSTRRIAGTPPPDLLRQPDFWVGQPWFVATILLGCISTLVLAPFTYEKARNVDFLIVLIVQSLAVYAAALTAKALATVEVENAIVAEIERKGTEYLRDVRSGQRARVDLEQLETSIIPVNPARPEPAMIRMFQHIVKEAKDRKFESSVQVMQPYREEPLDDIFKLQNLQKIVLWLGILGTFIGLLFAIDAADTQGRDFMAIVQDMFAGLSIAFSASLAGLQVAVFVGFLLVVVRKAQERYYKEMESAVVTMLSLARNSINKDEFLAELGQVTETMKDLTHIVHAQTLEVAQQTSAIRHGVEGLADARKKFDGFLAGLDASQKQFIDEIRSVYDTISLHELSATLKGGMADAGRELDAAARRLASTLEHQADVSAETAKKVAALVHGSATETTRAIQAIVTRVQEMAAREQTMRSDVQELSRRILILTNTLEKLDRGAQPRTFSIRELFASLRW